MTGPTASGPIPPAPTPAPEATPEPAPAPEPAEPAAYESQPEAAPAPEEYTPETAYGDDSQPAPQDADTGGEDDGDELLLGSETMMPRDSAPAPAPAPLLFDLLGRHGEGLPVALGPALVDVPAASQGAAADAEEGQGIHEVLCQAEEEGSETLPDLPGELAL